MMAKTTKRVTIDDVMGWMPCLPRKQIAEYFSGRKYMTIALLKRLDIRTVDKLWCLLRPEVIPVPTLHALACDFAEYVLLREREAGREPDPRSWRAVEIKGAWIYGLATDDELRAAREAAWKMAGAAAGAAAWWAAGVTARTAAWEAAEAAGGGEAEKEWQLSQVLNLITPT